MGNKLLTVTIPAYNVADYIDDCIQSILIKDNNLLEILVIDDGSTDKTLEVAKKYERLYPDVVRVIHKENGGHGSGINVGISNATGKYFKVIDADDWVDREAFQSFLNKLSMCDSDMIATPYTLVYTDRDKEVYGQVQGTEKMEPYIEYPFVLYSKNLYVKMHQVTFRTSILQQMQYSISHNSFYVDIQYILYPIPLIQTIAYFPENVYRYRLGRDGQSVNIKNMQKNRMQHENILRGLLNFFKEQEKNKCTQDVLQYLASGIARMYANQVLIYLSLGNSRKIKSEFVEFDQRIHAEYRYIYRSNNKVSIWLLRQSKYSLWKVAVLLYKFRKK